MVEIQAGENASGLTLRNPDDQPLYGQVRLFRWDQADGNDTLTPTQDIVASPPIVEIAPRTSQLVRLVRITTAPPTTEQSYRMVVDELPRPNLTPTTGITIRLRYSLPVFIEPAGAMGQPSLSWHLIHTDQGWIMRVDNTGTRRAQIAAIELVNQNAKVYEINKGLLGYALAGRGRQWQISLPPQADLSGVVKVRAAINSLHTEAVVTVEQTK